MNLLDSLPKAGDRVTSYRRWEVLRLSIPLLEWTENDEILNPVDT
jgi:hypothetical protein